MVIAIDRAVDSAIGRTVHIAIDRAEYIDMERAGGQYLSIHVRLGSALAVSILLPFPG